MNEEDRIFNGSLEDYNWKDSKGSFIEEDKINEFLKSESLKNIEYALEKYVPIGTVVKLKKHPGSFMIIGFKQLNQNNEENDYLACEYPYGISKDKNLISFNHDVIDKVYHIGMVNDLEIKYKNDLNSENNLNKNR